jgi:inorganic pyrophosphatase
MRVGTVRPAGRLRPEKILIITQENSMAKFVLTLAAFSAALFTFSAAPARATDDVQVIEIRGKDEARDASRSDDDRDEDGVVYLDQWTLKGHRNFLSGYPTKNADGTYNVAVEIPTGTSEKWETCTSSSLKDPVAFPRCNEAKPGRIMVQEVKKGARRVVSFLGYPGNYGSLPRTKGADGDPLDIIAVGPAIERGTVVAAKVVGVIRCIDGTDQDDKVIALTAASPLFAKVNTLADLNTQAVNGAEILRQWFDSYKGAKPGSGMDCSKVDDEVVAKQLIADAQAAFTSP